MLNVHSVWAREREKIIVENRIRCYIYWCNFDMSFFPFFSLSIFSIHIYLPYIAMDVLLSTASIMNLCLISLDRYWSITKAVEYLKTRTPARALVMIAAVWIMSALICIPPLLGWGVKRSEDSLPQCEVSFPLSFLQFFAYKTLGTDENTENSPWFKVRLS